MLKLAELQKKGEFKPNREVDVLSTTIGSKEHRGRVRGMSSKLSIKDGLRRTGLGIGVMTDIKKKALLLQRMQWKQGSNIYFMQHLRSSSSQGN